MKATWMGMLVIVGSLLFLSCDDEPENRGETVEEAFARLQEEQTVTDALWDSTGTLKFLSGNYTVENPPEEYGDYLLEFLYNYRGLFRITNPWREFEVNYVTIPIGHAIVSLRQVYHDYVVQGGYVTAMFNDDGAIYWLRSEYRAGIHVDPNPTLSEEDAKDRFTELSGADLAVCSFIDSGLFIWINGAHPALAWSVTGFCSDEEGLIQRYIDAHTGELLYEYQIDF